MTWRAAKSIIELRDQLNGLFPHRLKSDDGTIGDERHQAGQSDHNPNQFGVVTAIDVTHDPAHGADGQKIADALVASRDHRIKYVIWNRHIINSTVKPWVWRSYNGRDPHTGHVHVSVSADPAIYDLAEPWSLPGLIPVTTPAPTPLPSSTIHSGIKSTVFGGSDDEQRSAYDGHLIGDNEVGFSLPYRFEGPRPLLGVTYKGVTVVGPIIDIGPWNIDDPYWLTNSRPQAETGTDHQGRHTNHAGIDATPAAARALGFERDGEAIVDWWFVQPGSPTTPVPEPKPMPPPPTVIPTSPPPGPAPAPAPQIDPQLAATLARLQATVEALAAREDVQKGWSTMLSGLLAGVSTMLPQLGVWGLVAQVALTVLGVMGPPAGSGATATGQITLATLLGSVVSGLFSKLPARTP